jgi:activator of HSP90 ATPase
MALWGKGDNRWIVNNLEDGKNVNSWHWDEIKITSQFKEDLGAYLINNQVLIEKINTKIIFSKFKSFSGDIMIVNRKGKKKLNYQFDFKIEAIIVDNDGKMHDVIISLPDIYDLEPEIEINKTMPQLQILESHIQSFIGDFINSYDIESIKTKHFKPNKKETKETDILKLKVKFNTNLYHLFKLFSDQELISKYTNSICLITPIPDTPLSFYNKKIIGTLLVFEQNKKIRYSSNMLGIETIITLYFNEIGTNAQITIHQSGIPTDDIENMTNEWKEKWFKPLCIMNNCNFNII